MKTFDKLQQRIKTDLELDAFEFKRTYAGYWQRASGAWLWVARKQINGIPSARDIGSPFSATYLIKYKGKLVICGDGTILTDD